MILSIQKKTNFPSPHKASHTHYLAAMTCNPAYIDLEFAKITRFVSAGFQMQKKMHRLFFSKCERGSLSIPLDQFKTLIVIIKPHSKKQIIEQFTSGIVRTEETYYGEISQRQHVERSLYESNFGMSELVRVLFPSFLAYESESGIHKMMDIFARYPSQFILEM